MGKPKVTRHRTISLRLVNTEGAELQELDIVERLFERECTGVGKRSQSAVITNLMLTDQLDFEKNNK